MATQTTPVTPVVDTSNLKVITLAEIKAQCRIDSTFTDEDTILVMYGESAEQMTFNYLERTYEELVETYTTIPVPIKHAILMLVAHSYAQREPASVQNLYTVPYTYDALIKPYMNL